ncbi:MAG: hypothetical protein H6917_15635 [Novosphingobium sp.]|nr:hypothetical protein [Novosphingobium sp.]MCP5403803.1 hypothetical protein [Novosphingobium sp.]
MTLVLLDENVAPRIIPRVPEGIANREHRLRDLIHDHPEIMPVHALDPSFGRIFTVARELSLPGVGFVDVLLADERGRLVVVECKLWRNPQARREVIGQILDYARELHRYEYEDLQRQITVATGREGNVLYELAREAGSELDEGALVDRVTSDLAAGRFLLLVVGDGIAEGTRRIGEYLRDQPGLAFEFGLIEIVEYQYADETGRERTIVQPRVLARTATIERHVIRSEVPGLVIDAIEDVRGGAGDRALSDVGLAWREFVARFVSGVSFDDPGQPLPRSGGVGWIRLPLPNGYYVNLYRDRSLQEIGAQVRFPGAEGEGAYAELAMDREAIDREFTSSDLPPLVWGNDDVPTIGLTKPSPLQWDEAREEDQRAWFAQVANQFVNSLRPRLQRIAGNSA